MKKASTRRNKEHKLDLPEHFDRKATEMLLKVADGRAAHRTGNIRSSGAPFEDSVRKLFSEALPKSNLVTSGYFYGAASSCSPQIDMLVYEAEEAFLLNPSRGEDYVPYTSVSVLGQLKNSTDDLPKAIEQIQKGHLLWNEMHNQQGTIGVPLGKPLERPLTFIVCGDSSKLRDKKLVKILTRSGRPWVDYILLLDRGEIIAGANDAFGDVEEVGFYEYRLKTGLYVCKPDGPSEHPKGLGLLWLYFAIVSKLHWDRGNNLRHHAFCRQIGLTYRLRATRQLVTLTPSNA